MTTSFASPWHSASSGTISRSKCVNAWCTGFSERGCISGRRNCPPAKLRAADSLLNSGRHHNPPQMPRSGRRSRNTLPSRSIATTIQARRDLRARAAALARGFGDGISCCRPLRRALQCTSSGQRAQAGRRRVHSVAPRSMIACVYVSTPSAGVQCSASAQSRCSIARVAALPSMPKQRASTRLTLPSRIACRARPDSARIAPAVERPIPGSAATAS